MFKTLSKVLELGVESRLKVIADGKALLVRLVPRKASVTQNVLSLFQKREPSMKSSVVASLSFDNIPQQPQTKDEYVL